MREVRITRSGRKHGLGKAHVIEAMIDAGEPEVEEDGDALLFVGKDSRGVEIEVVAVPDDRNEDGLAVIHAMPTKYRE
jgi:hypothetical protein